MTEEQLKNKALNDIEYSSGQVELQSSPLNIIFCTSYKCNMRCIFCLERGNDPDFSFDIYRNLFEKKLGDIIAKATHAFYVGWGEILLLPGIEDFLDYLNKNIPEVTKTFTTNGVPLNQNLILKMIESKYALQISLHTSNALRHRLLTQTDYFEDIKRRIEYLIYLKDERNLSNLWLNLIFLITTLNIENLPDFIDFAWQLKANSVTCNYLTIFKPEHIQMSCFFLQETTNRMFDEAEKRAKKYGMELFLPPRFGTGESISKIEPCRYPWDHLYIDTSGNILTCCYAGEPIGNLNNSDFASIWNGEEYVQLRSSLIQRKPHKRCKNCFKFSPSNVDDMRSHITFRSGTQEDIFKVLGLEKKF